MRSHKFIFILSFFLAALFARAQNLPVDGCPQWQWLNPSPNASRYKQIFSTRQGIIAYSPPEGVLSRDGGKTWQEFTAKDTAPWRLFTMSAVQFVNDSIGFFVNPDNELICKSTDGGIYWFTDSAYPRNDTDKVGDVIKGNIHMVTENFGWELMPGDSPNTSVIYATTNAGNDWYIARFDTLQHTNDNISYVYFLDSLHGWVCKSVFSQPTPPYFTDSLLRTTNGGKTWSSQFMTTNGILIPNPFQFINAIDGYGIANLYGNSYFVSTTDAGATWTPFHTPLMENDSGRRIVWTVNKSGVLSALLIPPSSLPYPFFDTSLLLTVFGITSDNGKTWVRDSSYPLDYGETENIDDYECFDKGTAGIVGNSGLVLVTTDSGKTWSKNDIFKLNGVLALFFIDRNTGFVLSDSLYKTYDAGRNWKAITDVAFPINIGYRYASFKAWNNLWICGDTIAYCSTDSGKTFHAAPALPADSLLEAVDFVDSLYGWAFNTWDAIWKTTDGGASWSLQRTGIPPNPDYAGIFLSSSMVDRDYGWILGDVPLRTTNGGATWDTFTVISLIDSSWRLFDYTFLSRTHGFAIGHGDFLYETHDGGMTWDSLSVPANGNIYFRDSLFGWCGDNVTTDGGRKWLQKNGCLQFGLHVWWADTSEGWEADGSDLIHYGSFDSVQVGVAEPPPLPFANALISNYPNPFSGMTNIEFGMPNEKPGTLKVYDMLGREVADLSKQVIPGSSIVQFDGSALSPGIYFCKGVFGTSEFTSKLVVIR